VKRNDYIDLEMQGIGIFKQLTTRISR